MKLQSVAAICAALVLATPAAQAQALSWHVGVGVAGALDDRGPYNVEADADNGATLLVGAGFGNGFGVEAAYVDLGRVIEPGIADAGFDLDGELWSVGATWTYTLDRVEPYAKLGWFSREEDGTSITIIGPRPLRIEDDGWMGEVGARWRVTEPFALRLGYVHYDFESGADGSAQLAAEWHF